MARSRPPYAGGRIHSRRGGRPRRAPWRRWPGSLRPARFGRPGTGRGTARSPGMVGSRCHRPDRQRLKHPAAGTRHQRRDRNRPKPMGEAVQVEQQQQQAGRDGDAGNRDAEVRDGVILDEPEQRERERHGAGEGGKDHLLQPVAVPQAHEPRRQGPGRRLDDEDADGHHKTEQRDHGADEDAEDAGGRRCRVPPGLRQLHHSVQPDGDLPDQRPGHRTQKRQEPQAPLQLLTEAEHDLPGHRDSPRGVTWPWTGASPRHPAAARPPARAQWTAPSRA
jgi:hypothetical protein